MLLICRSRTYMLSVVATMLLLLLLHSAVAQTMIPASGDNIFAEDDAPFDRQISGLSKCSQTSLELWGLGPNDPLEPCILYDIGASATGSVGENPARSTTVTLVQVTPSRCHDHRDGVVTGVIKLNEANEGRGIAIGHFKDFHVKFKLITVIAGNTDYLDSAEYDRRHVDLLNGMVETYQPQYIVGTCSWKASLEPVIALQHQKMLMAQVGPPGYYTDEGNPYVFGFHINSDNYPLPAMQNVRFHAARHGGAQKQSIRVVYRNKSEFFKSTCRSVVKEAKKSGFTDLLEIEFDPFADDDGDGDTNSFDEDFLKDIADQACPPGSDQEDVHPAIFVCSIVEQDILLERWRENGCRPVSLWMTTATWAWTASNLGSVPYIQGGGQWHEAFTYSDDYFSSGSELLSYNEEQFGYRGTYDVVAGYSMAILFSQHIVASYRADNDPLIQTDFFNDDGYEILRRKLLVLTADTLFGPFSLNRFKRNIGRGAAGTQWLPKKSNSNSTLQEYDNKCISPLQQAESAGVIPAMAASLCAAGEFLSLDKIQKEEAILTGKCNLCPVDTISLLPNSDQQCNKCVVGAITEGQEGQSACIGQNPNLLAPGIKILGYAFAGISWFLALFFLVWLCIHRKDPVVRISQIEFLILICVGAVISSSSIVALNYEADVGEDTTAATKACMAVPFLYTIGWVLQYASLCAKSYRLHKVTNAPSFHRVKVTAFSMFRLIAVALLCDLIVVVVWTLISPLEYEREVTGTHWDAPNGLITVISVGECRNSSDVSVWAFVGPLIFLHIILMISTNFLLWKNRGVEDRYQESRYVAMASVYVFEILVIGIPVLVAVGDDSRAKYIVFCAIVFLNDVGILCLIFIPKMLFVRQGLPEGVSVSESVGRKSMQDAVRRQSVFVLKTGNSSGLMSKKLGSSNSLTVSDPKLAVLEHTDDGDERDHSGRLSGGPYMVSGSYIDDKSLIAAVRSGTPQIKTKNDDGVVLETYEIDAAAAAATTEGDMLSTTSATNETMEDSLSYLKDDSQMLGDRAIVIPPTTNKGALSTTSSTDEMLEDSAIFAEEDSHSDNIIANIAKDV